MAPSIGIVVLAAGLGTRMKSDKAKVLHEICGRPMIEYVVRTANAIAGSNVVVVVGHQAETVKKVVGDVGQAQFAIQEQQLGTGHAVLSAMPQIPDSVEHVIILCGDVPLIQKATIEHLISDHISNDRDVSVLCVSVDNPTGYGRMIIDEDGSLTAIVEEADADEVQKRLKTINSGIYIVLKSYLSSSLPQLQADNAQNEIYLTDIVKIAHNEQRTIGAVMGRDSNEIIGVNSPVELKMAENLLKNRDL